MGYCRFPNIDRNVLPPQSDESLTIPNRMAPSHNHALRDYSECNRRGFQDQLHLESYAPKTVAAKLLFVFQDFVILQAIVRDRRLTAIPE